MVDKHKKKILRIDFSNGKKHDFKLFKESKVKINRNIKLLGDTGYQGIDKLIKNSETPHKKTKKKELTKDQKIENQELSSERIVVKNVIGSLKRFRILSERYRNRRKRFGLRFNLIAGIHNFELDI